MMQPMPFRTFLATRIASFRHAFRGCWHVLRTQRNAQIHATAALLVLAVCAWLSIPTRDWAVVLLTIAMVLALEFVNTAIEAAVDLVSPDHHELAKVSKDVGAGAVLVASFAAVLIGILILGPPLYAKFFLGFSAE